ncbi:MAG: hypothetical protein J6T10_22770 [Methanobrevibacter sp.]|nr:hypothetical protein [Methanobrevibacter sp.]
MFNGENGFTMPVAPMFAGGGYGGSGFFGGDGFASIIWVVVILALLGGNWGNGGFFGNNSGLQGALTRGELCQDMDFQDVQSGIRGIQQSLSDGFALQNTNFVDRVDNLGTQIATGFDALNLAIVNDGYQTRNAATQNMIANLQNTNAIQSEIKDCCCNVQSGFAQIAYNQATDTCAIQNSISNATRDITENANGNTRAILDFLVQDKISTLQQENQDLRLRASQEAQNNYLVNELRPAARPAYITCNPYTSAYGLGMNNCCGCGA